MNSENELATLPRDLFVEVWEVADGERFPILKKYQVALALSGRRPLDRGAGTYQDAESLVKLRDCLVHHKPEWDDEGGKHQNLENRLHGKFTLSPYAAEGSLWFPHVCLGAGCAEWAVGAARRFSDEVCAGLGISKRTE